jgi:hypothetical protein
MGRRGRGKKDEIQHDEAPEEEEEQIAEEPLLVGKSKKTKKKKEIKPFEWTRVVAKKTRVNTRVRMYDGLDDLKNFEEKIDLRVSTTSSDLALKYFPEAFEKRDWAEVRAAECIDVPGLSKIAKQANQIRTTLLERAISLENDLKTSTLDGGAKEKRFAHKLYRSKLNKNDGDCCK